MTGSKTLELSYGLRFCLFIYVLFCFCQNEQGNHREGIPRSRRRSKVLHVLRISERLGIPRKGNPVLRTVPRGRLFVTCKNLLVYYDLRRVFRVKLSSQ